MGTIGFFRRSVLAIRTVIEELSSDDRVQVGFITFDNTLHFYHLKVCSRVFLCYVDACTNLLQSPLHLHFACSLALPLVIFCKGFLLQFPSFPLFAHTQRGGSVPHMIVLPNVEEVFLPVPDDLLYTLKDNCAAGLSVLWLLHLWYCGYCTKIVISLFATFPLLQ